MYTINVLAEELGKDKSKIIDELTNSGYLKKNGEPRQATIDNGLMNKNGKITQTGWNTFIAEIIIRESVINKKNMKNYICAAIKGAKAIFSKNDPGFLIESITSVCECVPSWINNGHTSAFIIKAFENLEQVPEREFNSRTGKWFCNKKICELNIFTILNTKEIKKELNSVLSYFDISEKSKKLICKLWYEDLQNQDHESALQVFYDNCKIYDNAYQKALNNYNDEKKAIMFANSCWEAGKLLTLKAK